MNTISFQKKDNFVTFESLKPGDFFIFYYDENTQSPSFYIKTEDFSYFQLGGSGPMLIRLTPQDLEHRDYEKLIACDTKITLMR